MSTNFYFKYVNEHIGERYSLGNGEVGFILAMPLDDVLVNCFNSFFSEVAIDEYGAVLKGEDMIRVLATCRNAIDHGSIGTKS